jgi:hypothetical protein
MKNTLLGWLAAKGIVLSNDASDHAVLQAIQKAFTDVTAPVQVLANEKETLSGQITALTNERDGFKGQVTALTNERDALKTRVTTERQGRAEAAVDVLIGKGKIKIADRGAHVTTLANAADEAAFAAEVEKLGKKANIIKLQSDAQSGKVLANTDGLDPRAVRATYNDALTKHMDDHPDCDPVKAHAAVMEAHPALAAAFRPKGDA